MSEQGTRGIAYSCSCIGQYPSAEMCSSSPAITNCAHFVNAPCVEYSGCDWVRARAGVVRVRAVRVVILGLGLG